MEQQYPDESGQNPYEFILNHGQQTPKPSVVRLPGSMDPFIKKLILLVGGALLIMLVLGIFAIVVGKGKTNAAVLTQIAQTQSEIARVAGLGSEHAVQQSTKSVAITTKVVVSSQQQELLKLLQKNGRKLDGKELGIKKNAQTDKKLTTAQQTDTYDTTFIAILKTALTSYSSELDKAYKGSAFQADKNLLKTDYDQTQLLLEQISQQ